MRIIKSPDTDVLFREMVDIECKPIRVDIPPVTDAGTPYTIDYTPTVGIVYCFKTPSEMITLTDEIRHKFSGVPLPHEDRHLVNSNYVIIKGPSSGRRSIKYMPECKSIEELPHASIDHDFTWIFIPIEVGMQLNSFNSMAYVNASLSGIIFDTRKIRTKYATGDRVELFSPNLFGIKKVQGNAEPLAQHYDKVVETNNIFIIDGNRIYFQADSSRMLYDDKPLPQNTARFSALPGDKCRCCTTPLYGKVIIIKNAHAPHPGEHKTYVLNTQIDKNILLCRYCYNSVISIECFKHLGADVAVIDWPISQAKSASNHLSWLLNCTIKPIPDAVGAFIARNEMGPEEIVITSSIYGKYPTLMNENIASLGLPVITLPLCSTVRP